MYLLENRKTKEKHKGKLVYTKCIHMDYFTSYSFIKNDYTYIVTFKNDEKIDLSCQFNIIDDITL